MKIMRLSFGDNAASKTFLTRFGFRFADGATTEARQSALERRDKVPSSTLKTGDTQEGVSRFL